MKRTICKLAAICVCVSGVITGTLFLSGMEPVKEASHMMNLVNQNVLYTPTIDIENLSNLEVTAVDIEYIPSHIPSDYYVGEYIPNPPKVEEPVEPIIETTQIQDVSSTYINIEVPIEQTTTRYYNVGVTLSDIEIRDLATLVFLESGNEPYECQLAVASVIINRMVNDGLSLYDVMYAPNQFSPASIISSSSPSESTLAAVYEVLQNGTTIPNYVTFFRASYYHNWSSYIVPYCVYGNTYFSADTRLY